jgi:hypothetical protein
MRFGLPGQATLRIFERSREYSRGFNMPQRFDFYGFADRATGHPHLRTGALPCEDHVDQPRGKDRRLAMRLDLRAGRRHGFVAMPGSNAFTARSRS